MAKSMDQLINDISSLTILELAALVKALEEKFGVSAASMGVGAASVAGAQAEAPKAEEKSEYKVELIESGADKMKVIKALRQVKKELGLMEAKSAVENPPFVVASAASKDDAKTMKETLEAAGAKVKLS